jgi:hypothetical protein
MGRKKRKVDDDAAEVAEPLEKQDQKETEANDETAAAAAADDEQVAADTATSNDTAEQAQPKTSRANTNTSTATLASSSYSNKTHSAEIFDTDIYVSDGSEDDEDDVNFVLLGSRMGIMRRGIMSHPLAQQNRQWVRPDQQQAEDETAAQDNNATTEEQRMAEELASLDPAQRAARLLQEKQRKLEEAKELARRLESEENAGRDPTNFSKRTAFDIRFDQIEDKPWDRGIGDISEFFNYGLTEEDWLEYGQQQLTIRQELVDAHREKRAVDPNIVPVIPKKPAAFAEGLEPVSAERSSDELGEGPDLQPLGPSTGEDVHNNQVASSLTGFELTDSDKEKYYNMDVGYGGAWGVSVTSDPKLAQLMEEQERNNSQAFKDEANKMQVDDDMNTFLPEDAHYHHLNNRQNWAEEGIKDRNTFLPEDGYPQNNEHGSSGTRGRSWQQGGPPPPPPPYRGRGFGGRGFAAGRSFDPRARGGRGGRFQGGEYHDQHQQQQQGNWR